MVEVFREAKSGGVRGGSPPRRNGGEYLRKYIEFLNACSLGHIRSERGGSGRGPADAHDARSPRPGSRTDAHDAGRGRSIPLLPGHSAKASLCGRDRSGPETARSLWRPSATSAGGKTADEGA